jgi:hypothetical protein
MIAVLLEPASLLFLLLWVLGFGLALSGSAADEARR